MATCKDCVHYEVCIFHITGNEYEKCMHFKNKADVVPVKHGFWKSGKGSYSTSSCSECGWKIPYTDDYFVIKQLYNIRYCPNCSAKMDGERKECN